MVSAEDWKRCVESLLEEQREMKEICKEWFTENDSYGVDSILDIADRMVKEIQRLRLEVKK